MPRSVTVKSLSAAFAVIEEMGGQDCEGARIGALPHGGPPGTAWRRDELTVQLDPAQRAEAEARLAARRRAP
jgi:hypothetical protein